MKYNTIITMAIMQKLPIDNDMTSHHKCFFSSPSALTNLPSSEIKSADDTLHLGYVKNTELVHNNRNVDINDSSSKFNSNWDPSCLLGWPPLSYRVVKGRTCIVTTKPTAMNSKLTCICMSPILAPKTCSTDMTIFRNTTVNSHHQNSGWQWE